MLDMPYLLHTRQWLFYTLVDTRHPAPTPDTRPLKLKCMPATRNPTPLKLKCMPATRNPTPLKLKCMPATRNPTPETRNTQAIAKETKAVFLNISLSTLQVG
jgi:hypothetical protein